METVHIENADAMKKFAGEFILKLPRFANAPVIITLSGELGAGKTTFAQGVAEALAVKETVNSPTFVIEKIYALEKGQPWQRLVHIDAYRLSSAGELHPLGWDEISRDPANLILIEWPQKVKDAIPSSAHCVSIEIEAEEARRVTYGT